MNKPFTPIFLPPRINMDEDLQRLLYRLERALGQLDGLASVLPNPNLLIAPLITSEAVSSARIEGSQSTVGDALLFEAGGEVKPENRDDNREIINYRRAMTDAERKLDEKYPFDLWMLRGLHGVLLGDSVRGGEKEPGAFRSRQNWIGAPGARMENATYIPPAPEKIAEMMENWLNYWRTDTPSPLVQMAVLHGQFEVIHPFMDGNGRIGRLLIPLFLREKGVLNRPVFYLSAQLEIRREEYLHRLIGLNMRPGEWREWIGFFLRTCEAQVQSNIRICRTLQNLHEELQQRAETILRSRYSAAFIDAVFARPVFSIRDLAFSGKRPGDLALNQMAKKLVAANILEKAVAGRRNRPTIYIMWSVIRATENR